MVRPSLPELERRCQKPDYRRVGNWMARRVTRPVALRLTWLIAPWGVTADAATLAAWAMAVLAAVAFSRAAAWAWVAGAALLQLWYLLDHVDGQLARFRGTASLDGVQLDYLMHHTVHVLVPVGVGWGLFNQSGQSMWMGCGVVWAVGLLVITLQHDARYKAFCQRLKRVHGRLEVIGGGGGRPEPQRPVPRNVLRLAPWTARKLSEMHVIMNLLTVVAVDRCWLDGVALVAARIVVTVCATAAVAVAVFSVVRSQLQGEAEAEFARWYRVPEGGQLLFRDGWWYVEGREDAMAGEDREASALGSQQSP